MAFSLLAGSWNYERMQNGLGLLIDPSYQTLHKKEDQRLLLNVTWNSCSTHTLPLPIIRSTIWRRKEQTVLQVMMRHQGVKLVWWVLWRVSEISLQFGTSYPWCPWCITLLRLVTSLAPHLLYRMECDSYNLLVVHPRTVTKAGSGTKDMSGGILQEHH